MAPGAIAMLVFCSMFPLLILVAIVVKLWEVHQAKSWLEAPGKVVASRVQSRRKKPSDLGFNSSDTEVENLPLVEYEYEVAGTKHRCSRITIGEKTSDDELEGILERYQVGTPVTVYYNPKNPKQAVLERDLPALAYWAAIILLAVFIGGPILAVLIYSNAVSWLKPILARPGTAPIVAILGCMGTVVILFGIVLERWVAEAKSWPTTKGGIVSAGVDKFRESDISDGIPVRRTVYKSAVMYRYEVQGREYLGDRLTLATKVTSNLSTFASRTAGKYPVGTEVVVHYDPKKPGQSVLYPRSASHFLIWVIAAVIFGLAWAIGSGRLG